MSNNKEVLSEVRKLIKPRCIGCVNRVADVIINLSGKIRGEVDNNRINLSNVLFSEQLPENLLAVWKLCEGGSDVTFTKREVIVKDENSGNIIMRGPYKRPFWRINMSVRGYSIYDR